MTTGECLPVLSSAIAMYLLDWARRDEEESREKGKGRLKRLAKQAGKLKGIFKKQGTEVQLSSARLVRFHENPSHKTQHKTNIPEHGRSSKEGLPAAFDDELHILEPSPPQVPNGIDPEDRFASVRESTLAREREVAKCECIPELPCTCGSRVLQVDRAKRPENIRMPDYLFGSHQSLAGSDTEEQNLESVQSKRRRRRESHNLVERRRRDNINERIRQLSHLVPLHHFEDYNAKLSRAGRTAESPDNGPNKGDVLNGTVSWTVDIMRALYRKIQQQSEAREYIHSLGGIWPFESNEVERQLQSEVIDAFDANGRISLPSRPWDSEVNRKERFESWEAKINARGDNHSEPALRTQTSYGSLISSSGSVHSLTSRTYRSASGEIKTEHAENVSNFEFNREILDFTPRDKLEIEKWEAGAPRWHSKLPFVPNTDIGPFSRPFSRPFLDQGIVPNTQTFINFPTSVELDEAPIPGLDEHEARKPDKQSSKLKPESHTSLDSQDGSRRDDCTGTAQRLDEADPLVRNDLADVNDLSAQNQMQPPIAAKMDGHAGLRPFGLQEDPPLGTSGSIALSNSCRDLVESDPRVTYLENKLVRLRWKCVCL